MSKAVPIDTRLRVHLAQATAQYLADQADVHVLGVKGPAVDPSLRPSTTFTTADGLEETRAALRASSDADVLVRPSHVDAYMRVLQQHGWRIVTHFDTGSAFEHAASMWHDKLGYIDVHRRFPGITIDAAEAFDLLWADHIVKEVAHVACAVPAVEHQRLIMLLHAARGGSRGASDTQLLWDEASEQTRARTHQLAERFGAQVALAAATGRLDDYADDPTADLWRVFALGEEPTRLQEWRARFRAAPTPAAKARIAAKSLLVNTDHLSMKLGRPVSRSEVAAEYVRRPWKAALEMADMAKARLGRAKEER